MTFCQLFNHHVFNAPIRRIEDTGTDRRGQESEIAKRKKKYYVNHPVPSCHESKFGRKIPKKDLNKNFGS
jgi:hypothetical protein